MRVCCHADKINENSKLIFDEVNIEVFDGSLTKRLIETFFNNQNVSRTFRVE